MYNLFLDDVRLPLQAANYGPPELSAMFRLLPWHIVRSYDEFVAIINQLGLPEKVSFDHDLADIHYDPSIWTEGFKYHDKTGHDCAKWLVQYCLEHNKDLPEYYCHSANPVGKENILAVLNTYKNFKKNE